MKKGFFKKEDRPEKIVNELFPKMNNEPKKELTDYEKFNPTRRKINNSEGEIYNSMVKEHEEKRNNMVNKPNNLYKEKKDSKVDYGENKFNI